MKSMVARVGILSACIALCAGIGACETRARVAQWECRVCGKRVQSFVDDDLGAKDLLREDAQWGRIFQLMDKSRKLDPCRGPSRTHDLVKKGTTTLALKAIAEDAKSFAVVKGGRTLGDVRLTRWECMLCNRPFWSLSDEDLNIRAWDRQPERIFALKEKRPIQKCPTRGYYGHVFKKKGTSSVRSWEIAEHLHEIFWVKD